MAPYPGPATLDELREALKLMLKNQQALADAIDEVANKMRQQEAPKDRKTWIQKPYNWGD